MRAGLSSASIAAVLLAAGAQAQAPTITRLAVLQAEGRRAPTEADLTRIRLAVRSADPQTARIALRALGRLERPALIGDILPRLGHTLPETRAEAANALAQAAQGWVAPRGAKPAVVAGQSPTSVLAALAARLKIEEDPDVRAALCESIGRLPYVSEEDVGAAEMELVALASRSDNVPDRLGVAKGLEALARISGNVQPLGPRAIDVLKGLLGILPLQIDPSVSERAGNEPSTREARANAGLARDARVRRLALEALTSAGAIDDAVVGRSVVDPDPQVRRLAVSASAASGRQTDTLVDALDDPVPMVRLEALRGLRKRPDDANCRMSIIMTADPDEQVVLVALDQLADCGDWQQAVTVLESTAEAAVGTTASRGWQRAAHALVALAHAAPDHAAPLLTSFATSEIWQLRLYAARAATAAQDGAVLRTLAFDRNDNVAEAALTGLAKIPRVEWDDLFVAALSRQGPQAVRAAALALDGTPDVEAAVPALKAALERLTADGRADFDLARAALASTLTSLGAPPAQTRPAASRASSPDSLTAANLKRLAAPRARLIVRDVGVVEIALFTSEAPSTVLRFAELAEAGYYNGLTFHRVEPNSLVQAGSPGANDNVDHAERIPDEVGLWPHVRGTVGLATRGRDTGGAQFFINLVDNPSFDHRYTVFAQVLNGIDVIDRILEGDAIERVEIIP